VAKHHRIAVIPGDGIGPEVVREGLRVLERAAALHGFAIRTTAYPFGAEHYLKTKEIFPDAAFGEVRGHDAILLGAIGDPSVPSGVLERGLLLRLRFELDHYVNLRPVRLYPGVASPLASARPETVDMVVVREGTEGPYTGAGGVMRKGTPAEVATQESVNTAFGVERVARYAFGKAMARPRRKLTLVHKTNVLTYAGDLWQRTVDALAKEFARGQRQHQPRGNRAEHVRAGARQRAGHRRPAEGRPHRGHPVRSHALRAPGAAGRGGQDRAGRGGRPAGTPGGVGGAHHRRGRRRHRRASSRLTRGPSGSGGSGLRLLWIPRR